jgi:hypothetical protein
MLFIGFPITYATAAKLIGLHPQIDHELIAERYTDFKLGLNYIYQDTCALGLIVKELSVSGNNFKHCYEGIEIIKEYTQLLMVKLKNAGINTETLEIVPARDQPPIIVNMPQPYIIVI